MEEKISKDYCSICRQNTNHSSLYKKANHSDRDDDFYWNESFEIIQCKGCDNIQFRYTYSDESMIGYKYVEEYGHDIEFNYDDKKYYPKNLNGHILLSNIYEVPDKIRIVYLETIEAIKNDCYLLSGVGLRAVIEAICIQQNISGKNLQLKINNLVKNKLITEKEASRLHSIRFIGNDSVHDMEVPKKDKLKVALVIIENLISNLYLIDIDANLHLDTIINDYESFRTLLIRKFVSINQNEEKSIKEVLGKDYRRIESSYISNFTEQIIDDINNGIIELISIGDVKKSTIENNSVQHFIKN